MFIRGNHPESVIWHHFRGAGDGFVFGRRDGWYEAQLLPNADRTIELFLALLEHLPPAVQVRVSDWRTGRSWHGEDLATLDVRDAMARIKHPLAAHAGVEITVLADDEQVTLTANLEMFVFARTDRWLYLLQGKGIRRVAALRRRSWHLERQDFRPVAAAESAVQLLADRLNLAAVREDTPNGDA